MTGTPNPERMRQLGVTADDLMPATEEAKRAIEHMRPSVSYWKDALRRFKRNKLAMVMLAILLVIVLAAILGPVLSPYSYEGISKASRQPPSLTHLFGTDKLGRDIFVRVMFGTRISLLVGVVTMVLVGLIGIIYGSVAAFIGGLVDDLMMRFVDLMMAIPSLLLIILLSVILHDPIMSLIKDPHFGALAKLGSGLLSLFICLAIFNWLGMARQVRGALLMNRHQEYVLAAQALGAKSRWVVMRHLLPNSIGIVIINLTAIVPGAILTESFLSFLGLGVAAPVPSLGSMANDALNGIQSYPLNMIFPASLISLIILCLNVFGDSLRDALDPRMRK